MKQNIVRISEPILVELKSGEHSHDRVVVTLDCYFLKKVAKHIAKTARCADCGKKIRYVINPMQFKPQDVELDPGRTLTIEYKLKIR